MKSYKEYIDDFAVHVEAWFFFSLGYRVPIGEYRPQPIEKYNAKQIRLRRSKAPCTVYDAIESFGPHLVGIYSCPWVWTELKDILAVIDTSYLYKDSVISYDKDMPVMVYSGDYTTLNSLFAKGDYDHELGEKVNCTSMDRDEFKGRGTAYLLSLLSQIKQAYERDFPEATVDGFDVTSQSAK